MDKLLNDQRVQTALTYLKEDDARTLREQLELCVIPAPSHDEERRARAMQRMFIDAGLDDVSMDDIFNVTGTISGGDGPTVMLAAHLDTVFPECTPLSVTERDGTYYCPGICDDTRGLAELLTIARAMRAADIRPRGNIIFCANVCEEGLGDLKGVKRIFSRRSDIDAFITIDNSLTGGIVYGAVGSVRHRVTFSGTGGHSFGDFGLPNSIHALGRAIADIAEWRVPDNPRTTFNVGIIEGGTSVNTIAGSASMLVDIRSTDPRELEHMTALLERAAADAAGAETRRWGGESIAASVELIGARPAGTQKPDSPIVCAAIAATRAVGLEPTPQEASSTDANIPISLGIPAIAVGRGGQGGGVHTLGEWYRPEKAYLGPQRNLLLLLANGY